MAIEVGADTGVAIASGTLKGVFAQGVLSAFEDGDLVFPAYACASSSVISGCMAAIGRSAELGRRYWVQAARESHATDMSEIVLESIRTHGPVIKRGIFGVASPRVMIATSRVDNGEARLITQSDRARKFGRMLLVKLLRGDASWVDENLTKVIFDSAPGAAPRLCRENFDAVAYASTRMMHAWKIPAEIAGDAYLDASYTCSCPAFELAAAGYRSVVVIDSQPGETYTSLGRRRVISDESSAAAGTGFLLIKPDRELSEFGVDFVRATEEGIGKCYAMGYEKGKQLLGTDRFREFISPDGR